MSQKDRKKLEDEYKKRFIYENNLRDLLNQDEKVEDSPKKVDIDEIITV